MVTQVDKRRNNKFYDFHNDKGHSTDECIHLKKQIEELVRAGKLSHLIKEIKQGRDQSKVGKKEAPAKEKSMAIYMGERRFACYRSRDGHMIHRMYVDGGDAKHSTKAWMNFMIIRSLSPYNGIIERLGIKEIQAVPSTAYRMLKFSVDGGIVTIRSTILIPTECAEIAIEGTVSAKGQTKLCSLLKENMDLFPWQPSDMTGVPRSVAEHRLNIQKGYPPMAESDEEKTAFHTSHGVYCYTKMPFGLKNAGATYQRLVDKAFDKHSLNGKLANLNRFLSKSVKKSLPLFKTLKKCIKKNDFHWTPKVEQAFKQLKQHLSKLPMLVAPKPKEELIAYMSASQSAISVVLMIERGTVQKLVYFVSGALQGPKLNYTLMEKLILALVFATKRAITKIERHAGRTQYHVPAKDIRERTDPSGLLYIEAGRNSTRYISAGLILTSSEGTEFTYALKFQFTASNNEAEYEALIAGLQIATQMGARNVHTKSLVSGFANFFISQVPRSKNKKADALSKIASTSFAHLSKQVLVQVLKEKSIQEKEVATVIEEGGPTWMTPIMKYLKDGTLPEDRKEASKLRIKARQYELLEGVLYSRMHARPRSVVAKAMRLGYYWPTMHRDARDMILKWTKKGKKFDSCYGLFYEVDRGESRGDNHWQSGEEVRMGQHSMSFWPSERNSLEKRSLGEGIKARLGEGKKNGIEELPHVLWAHRTMIRSCHGDTPFFLTYGTKAVILMEIRMPTYHTTVVDTMHNDEELRLNLDLLKKRHEHAAIQKAKAKLKMRKYYNARVRSVTFRPGEFVYRSNEASHVMGGGKLGPKWEGSYEVMEALGDGAYRLSHLSLCGGIRQRNRQPPRSDGGHGYEDTVGSDNDKIVDPMDVYNNVGNNVKNKDEFIWGIVEGYRKMSEIDVSADIVSQFPVLHGGEFARPGGQSEWLDQKGEDSSGTVEEARKWYKLIGKMV
nr:hypothetical protein [Tanacetum cinerariifolium]